MSARRVEPVRGRDGALRAVRLHLRHDENGGPIRTGPAQPGLRVEFDALGRPLVLEIEAEGPAGPERIDGVLEALGQPPLDEEERAAVRSAG